MVETAQKDRPKVGVGILVLRKINGKDHVMLHQRKGKLGTGYWGSGGGHLELGESLEDGALRELSEEAGPNFKVKNARFLGVINFAEFAPKHYVDVSFVAEWDDGEPTNNSPRETTEWKWFPLDNLPTPLFPPVKIYFEFLKTGKYFCDSSFPSDVEGEK